MDLFVDLRDFYAGKTSADVNSIMDQFFSTLVIRLYKIMNWGNQLSDSYLACLFKQMDNLQPFGDIPATTSGHLKLHAPITRNGELVPVDVIAFAMLPLMAFGGKQFHC